MADPRFNAEWEVLFCYVSTVPKRFRAADVCAALQAYADAKPYKPAIGPLTFNRKGNEVGAFFIRRGRKLRYAKVRRVQ